MKPYVPLVTPNSPPKTTKEKEEYQPLVMGVAKQCLPDEEKVVKLLQGKQGLPGPTANPGPGFKLVGVELRYDIATLPRG
jgi:hypothetical protein